MEADSAATTTPVHTDAATMPSRDARLQVSFQVEPVQHNAECEGQNQNQNDRLDAHMDAPVLL